MIKTNDASCVQDGQESVSKSCVAALLLQIHDELVFEVRYKLFINPFLSPLMTCSQRARGFWLVLLHR